MLMGYHGIYIYIIHIIYIIQYIMCIYIYTVIYIIIYPYEKGKNT